MFRLGHVRDSEPAAVTGRAAARRSPFRIRFHPASGSGPGERMEGVRLAPRSTHSSFGSQRHFPSKSRPGNAH